MSEPRPPGGLPPDLPPEYAEAYRRGYERAYQEATRGASDPAEADDLPPEAQELPDTEGAEAPAPPKPLFVDELDDDLEPTQVVRLDPEPEPAHWGGDLGDDLADDLVNEPVHEEPDAKPRRPGWLVPALLAGLVLLLVIAAYGMGRVFSSSVEDADVSAPQPDGEVLGDGAEQAQGSAEGGDGKPNAEPRDAYQGRTELAAIGGATASCQAPSSVDAAGNQIGYPPTNTYDGDLTTAWRCNGDGVGQSLTLTLPEATRIGQVGLVPGYAKTDPRSGVDRYAENNRITRVRWTFADGTSVEQRLDGSATNREVQTLRIPASESDTVVLEVLASTPGPRNTMAVSEIQLGRAVE